MDKPSAIASMSSYSTALSQVKYGLNKKHERLAQINLALLFGQESGLPFYYRNFAGNIAGVKTVQNLLTNLKTLGYSNIKLVMDRGFYSEDNVNGLFHVHYRFIMSTKVNLKYVKLDLESDELCKNHDSDYRKYFTVQVLANGERRRTIYSASTHFRVYLTNLM